MLKSSISTAENNLFTYLPKAGEYYEKNRNYSLDFETKKNTTSLLSPYIRYRAISEEKILKRVLEYHGHKKAEKYIQEIFWRTYWKGWLEHKPEVYSDYINEKNRLIKEFKNKKYYLNAINGNTNLSFYNEWIKELRRQGYLHNHIRMWFASIWIFTLKLPWQLGADFFMQHLLDGDPASNTLSWRWSAGIQTKGKNYIAKKKNIEKYSNIKLKYDEILEENVDPIFENKDYKISNLNTNIILNNSEIINIIIPTDEINILKDFNINKCNVFSGYPKEDYNDHNFTCKVLDHIKNLVLSCYKDDEFYNDMKIETSFDKYYRDLDNWITKNNIKIIHLPYVTQGNWKKIYKKIIKKYPNINFIKFNRNYDINSWIYSKKGYFKFKQNIPDIIKNI
tara:strand:- start:46 stop:1227 length:1182 start_codon:yes stop_codon:yes gene_type:complete